MLTKYRFVQHAGVAAQLRMAVTNGHPQVAFKVGDCWFFARLDAFRVTAQKADHLAVKARATGWPGSNGCVEADAMEVLQDMVRQRSDATIGARLGTRMRPELLWVDSPQGQLRPLDSRALVREGWAILGAFAALALVALLAGAWAWSQLFQGSHPARFFYVASILAFATSLTLATAALAEGMARVRYGFNAAVRQSNRIWAERQAQTDVATDRVTSRVPSGDIPKPVLASPPALASDWKPLGAYQLHATTGAVTGLDATPMHVGENMPGLSLPWGYYPGVHNRIDFTAYRFSMAGDAYVMLASEHLGGGDVFLAQNDRVRVVVAAPDPRSQDQPKLVWGLRNLEDGYSYTCHRAMLAANAIFPGALGDCRMSGYTHSTTRASLRFGLLVWAGCVLFALVFGTWADGLSGDLTRFLLGFAVTLPAWLGLVIAFFLAPLVLAVNAIRQRRGPMSLLERAAGKRRQQHDIDRCVYRLLGLEPDHLPDTHIEI